MYSFADKLIRFYQTLEIDFALPEGVEVMYPHIGPLAGDIFSRFYKKFYDDNHPRTFIIGINPGRFGGGITGIPFTDPVKLALYCGIPNNLGSKTELSADFIYQMIEAYGGVQKFYNHFYFTAMSPLGFTRNGLNMNYYDDRAFAQKLQPLMAAWLRTQLDFGGRRNRCICLGSGKNLAFLQELNQRYMLFNKIDTLDHPRFIMQYRRKKLHEYINQYLDLLSREG